MLQYDLSDTAIATSVHALLPPNEGEQLALLVALMIVERCSYADLRNRSLTLTQDNRDAVIRALRTDLQVLAHAFPDEVTMRERMDELLGLRVKRGW